jgi:hypothetical protein
MRATPEAFPGDYQDVNVHRGDSLSTDRRPDRFVGTLYGVYRRQHRGRVDGSQLCFASDG